MQRKKMFYQRFFNWIKWSVIIDFSTEHNLTSIYPFFHFLFLSIWRTAALKLEKWFTSGSKKNPTSLAHSAEQRNPNPKVRSRGPSKTSNRLVMIEIWQTTLVSFHLLLENPGTVVNWLTVVILSIQFKIITNKNKHAAVRNISFYTDMSLLTVHTCSMYGWCYSVSL